MTTFDLEHIQAFVAHITAELDRCDAAATGCAPTGNSTLRSAGFYDAFCDELQHWAREVFAGHMKADPAVEKIWREETKQLFWRAFHQLLRAQGDTAFAKDAPG